MADDKPELSPEAKQLIADSIAIVREDRFEKWVRDNLGKKGDPPPDPDNPSKNAPPNGPPPPPKGDPPPSKENAHAPIWGNYADS